EFLKSVAAEDHHSGFLGVGGIDKHALCHSGRTPGRAAAANRGGGAAPWARKPWPFDLSASRNCGIGVASKSSHPASGFSNSHRRDTATRRGGKTCCRCCGVGSQRRREPPVGEIRTVNVPGKCRYLNDFVRRGRGRGATALWRRAAGA